MTLLLCDIDCGELINYSKDGIILMILWIPFQQGTYMTMTCFINHFGFISDYQ